MAGSANIRHGLTGLILLISCVAAAETDSSLTGTLLVASPDMPDNRFSQTVILMLKHDNQGTFGVIVNQPSPFSLSDVTPELTQSPNNDYPLNYGGPVDLEALSLLLRTDHPPDGIFKIHEGFYFTRETRVFDKVIARQPSASDLRVILGYAGWAPNQLESEIKRSDWRIVPGKAMQILDIDQNELWQHLIEQTGGMAPTHIPGEENLI